MERVRGRSGSGGDQRHGWHQREPRTDLLSRWDCGRPLASKRGRDVSGDRRRRGGGGSRPAPRVGRGRRRRHRTLRGDDRRHLPRQQPEELVGLRRDAIGGPGVDLHREHTDDVAVALHRDGHRGEAAPAAGPRPGPPLQIGDRGHHPGFDGQGTQAGQERVAVAKASQHFQLPAVVGNAPDDHPARADEPRCRVEARVEGHQRWLLLSHARSTVERAHPLPHQRHRHRRRRRRFPVYGRRPRQHPRWFETESHRLRRGSAAAPEQPRDHELHDGDEGDDRRHLAVAGRHAEVIGCDGRVTSVKHRADAGACRRPLHTVEAGADRGQKAEGKRQKAEGRRQKAQR